MRPSTYARGRRLALVVCLLAGLSVACVDVRGRPGGPTEPDDRSSQPSFVSITQPEEGEEVARSTLTSEPGLSVTFTGRFRTGEGLLLLVFSDASPFTPVFISEARVEQGDTPRSAWVQLPPETVDQASEMEILLRVLEGTTDRVISTDSVGVVLR